MAGNRAAKRDYRVLRRYLAGINVLSVFLVIVASQLAGATVGGTALRAAGACIVLLAIQMLLIRTWSAFEVVNSQKQVLRKRS